MADRAGAATRNVYYNFTSTSSSKLYKPDTDGIFCSPYDHRTFLRSTVTRLDREPMLPSISQRRPSTRGTTPRTGRLTYGAFSPRHSSQAGNRTASALVSPRITVARTDGAGASSALQGSSRDTMKWTNDQSRRSSTYRHTYRGGLVRTALYALCRGQVVGGNMCHCGRATA